MYTESTKINSHTRKLPEQIIETPRLICNNKKTKTKVREELVNRIEECDSFDMSVAFVAESGISAIQQPLIEFAKNNKKGRIVTSTYLGFNSPKVFNFLLHIFKNTQVEIRIYQGDGFHPKGYIFNNAEKYKIIIGSSNLTQSALCVNQEWNICISGSKEDDVVKRVRSEFEQQWNESVPLTNDWIEEYKRTYKPPIKYYVATGNKKFEPNKMQTEALLNINEMRKQGKKKALLISATGTGKTYLSAFDVKAANPERMLFVVHRETIARKAMETFKKVMPDKKMGMFTGSEKDFDCDYLFSTISTMGKEKYLEKFDKNNFDYIVIDEVHKAGAMMYKKLIDYFEPEFMLGMSATPERSDRPETIYELFEYNIAYEIRLQQAMEYDLLCPFHYFGIADIEIDGVSINDATDFNMLVDNRRFKHILEAIEMYGYHGEKPHGLIFVSRKEEAQKLCEYFRDNTGYKTVALTGSDSEDKRKEAIQMLEEEDVNKNYLDYIITVDIFNEGVDIPCVNQVVMARPTQSAIIFIQQLGRGLRKTDSKEYVVVIDIIGNYNNNFMIPQALYGTRPGIKEEPRKQIHKGDISGCTTVSFDDITKKRIYESIDKAKLNSLQIIREQYNTLKAKLGNRIPRLIEFDKYSSIDPLAIFRAHKNGKRFDSYYNFLIQEDEDNYDIRLNEKETRYINGISTKFASGKRVQELVLIKQLLVGDSNVFERTKKVLLSEYGFDYDEKLTKTIINELTGKFSVGSGEKYEDVILIEKDDNDYRISSEFKKMLSNKDFRCVLEETLEFAFSRFEKEYSDRYMNTDFVLYQKYTYEDVFRLLNWEKADVAQNVGGYKYDKYSNTFPVFVNYDKTKASETVQYEDVFSEDCTHFYAVSKHPRSLTSPDAQVIEKAKENGTAIHMFVRKNNIDEVKEFYYLGLVEKDGSLEEMKMESTGAKVFRIPYKFRELVRDDVLSYLLS